MTTDDGRSPSGPGQSGQAPEPASSLGHSATVPNAIEPELAKALIAAPRRLMRERGWSGARSHGMVQIMERRLIGLIEHGPTWEESPMHDDKTFSLKPMRECIAIFNVSRENRVGIWASAPLSSREYGNIIRMMELDQQTMREEEEAAQGTLTRRAETGTGSVGEADSGPVGNADAPKPHPHGGQNDRR